MNNEDIMEGRIEAQSGTVIYGIAYFVELLFCASCLILLLLTGNFWFIVLYIVGIINVYFYIKWFKQDLAKLYVIRGVYGR